MQKSPRFRALPDRGRPTDEGGINGKNHTLGKGDVKAKKNFPHENLPQRIRTPRRTPETGAF
jgi:hypothetical protein